LKNRWQNDQSFVNLSAPFEPFVVKKMQTKKSKPQRNTKENTKEHKGKTKLGGNK